MPAGVNTRSLVKPWASAATPSGHPQDEGAVGGGAMVDHRNSSKRCRATAGDADHLANSLFMLVDIHAGKCRSWRLERLDLNLLRVFQAIDAERNVTRAAVRLGDHPVGREQRSGAATRGVRRRAVPARSRAAWSRRHWPASSPARRRRTRRGACGGRAQPALRPGERARRVRDRRVGLCRVRPRRHLGREQQARAPDVSVVFRHPIARGRWPCSTRTGPIWRSGCSPSRRPG